MHSGRKPREAVRSETIYVRVTGAEKRVLRALADGAGETLSDYARNVVLKRVETVDARAQELLRIMAEIVQQNVVAQAGSVTQEMIEGFERTAARKAGVVLGRRLRLLERMAEEAKGAAA